MNNDLAPVHQKMFQMLGAFHDFCENHGLTYFIVGGTLLGAVRHRGFIPWDDDVDLAMPRHDYERLLALADIFPAPLSIAHFSRDESYVYPYIKVYDITTTVTENFVIPFTRGVWLDVFPIDGVPANKITRYLQLATIAGLRFALRSRLSCYFKTDRFFLLRRLVGAVMKLVPRRAIFGILDRVVQIERPGDSPCSANLLGRWSEREIVDKDVLVVGDRLPFGPLKLYAPAKSHDYLRAIYGDYMVWPPEDQRVSGHGVSIDLGASFVAPSAHTFGD